MRFHFLIAVLCLTGTSPSAKGDDLNVPVSKEERARAFIEQNADSTPAFKNAYVGAQMIKAEEEARHNPQIQNDIQAIRDHVRNATEIARQKTEGVSFRSGFLESGLKGVVDVGAAAGAVTALPTTPVGSAAVAATVKVTGDLIVEAGLDYLSDKPVDVNMNPDVAANIREIMARKAQDKSEPLGDLYRQEFIDTEQRDPAAFSEGTLKRNVLLRLAGNQDDLKAVVATARDTKELADGIRRIGAKQLATLNALSLEVHSTLEMAGQHQATQSAVRIIVSQEQNLRRERELEQAKRDEITNGFDGLSGIAKLGGSPELASKLKTGGQLAGVLHDMRGATAQKLLSNPTNYLNSTVLAINLATTLLGGSQDGEMAAVMSGISALQAQIADLRRVMLEEFRKLNIKIDAYFIDTFERLDRLQASENVNIALVKDVLRQIMAVHDQVKDGFHENLLISLNQTLSGCLVPNLNLTESDFATCRNILGLISTAKINPNMLDSRTSAKDMEKWGVAKYLWQAAVEVRPNEFNYSLVHPDDWNWATEKLLRMVSLHPKMKKYVLYDFVNKIPLQDIIRAGTTLRSFNAQIGSDKNGHPRQDVFDVLLNRYQGLISKSISQAIDTFTEDRDRGPRAGLDFDSDVFVPDDSDEFLKSKIAMCPGKQAQFDPHVNLCGGGTGNKCGFGIDNAAVHALTAVGDQKLSDAFASYIPKSVLFGVRQTSGTQEKRKTTLSACFDRWEVLDANMNGSNNAKFAITLKLGFEYFERGKDKPTHVHVKNLTANRATSGHGDLENYNWSDGPPMALVVWNGGYVSGTNKALNPPKGIAEDPRETLTDSGIVDAEALKIYEAQYSEQLQARNGRIHDRLNDVSKRYSETETIKGAMLYILEQYDDKSEVVVQFYDWLADESHLPKAEKWNELFFNGKLTETQLRGKLNADLMVAKSFVEALSQSHPTPLPTGSIDARIAQLEKLRKEAEKLN